MGDYISRDAAIVAIKNLYPGIPLVKFRLEKWHEENKNFMECEQAIERIPAADVRPVVQAQWIEKPVNVGTPNTDYFCSNCNFASWNFKTNYCPNCGAYMREGC